MCFETNFKEVRKRKEQKHRELVEEVEENGYVVDFVTIEVGSRGFINFDSFCRLRDTVGASNRELKHMLSALSKTAIKESFTIWINCNHMQKSP